MSIEELPLCYKARDIAVEAAWKAARVIRMHAGRLDSASVAYKGTHDLVTSIDEMSQQIIKEVVQAAFPAFHFLAEEGEDGVDQASSVEGYRWIIDPIDGTTNFAHGIPPYAVSIALQEGQDIVVGVVLDVASGDLFSAIRGEGAYCNGARIQVNKTTDLSQSVITTGFPYRSFGHIDEYLMVLRQFMQAARGVRRPGSAAVDLAWVACGRFSGFFETGLSAWDVAAGSLIVEEAGGKVTDFSNNANPAFARQILATNGLVHQAMLDIVTPLRNSTG